MRNVVIPHNVPSDVQRAFQQVNLALRELCIPLLTKESSLSGIAEGTRAHFMEGDKLYRYTKVGGKLFKEEVSEHFEEGSSVEFIRQVEVSAGAPKKVVAAYRRVANAPAAMSFDVEWYRLDGEQQPQSVPSEEEPTDVSFSPQTPSLETGKHYVEVTFTPQTFELGIIGRVLVREEGDT